MALPQPTNTPRIIEVLDPGANQHTVEVRMPPQLASKYPDKPWGTAIDTIGLQKKDSDRFVGYTLVDIQPMRDSEDLKWIFEKLSGPVWTTTTVGSENIIPEKFRSQVSQTKTKQEVVPATVPDAITGDLISSTVEDQDNTGKSWKVNISETIDANATALVSPSLEDQLYVTTEILVVEGSQPDQGPGVIESTVQAIGKGKAIKTSKFAVTAYTNKTTWTVGYATLINESVGTADVIPAKFRALKALKTWRFRVQQAGPPTDPALGVGSGAYSGYDIVERTTKQTQENGTTDVFEVVVVGLKNTGKDSLDSVTYGKIVTTETTETLDATAQVIDTGLAIIASTVEELGNGLTIKSTEKVQGGVWPNPVEEEVVSDATQQPPARYLKDLTRTTRKEMVSMVGSTTLSGNEIAKSFKRETPDRVAKTTTTEDINLDLTAIDEDVQQKPFVKITSVMTPGTTKVLPTDRNGSAKRVYDQGNNEIWENTEEIADAREGPAGTEKDTKPFVEITTDKRYSTTNSINTTSGGANIVFNDGTTQIYEVSEVTSSGRYGPAGAEQQTKPFVKITSEKSYEATGVLPGDAVGSSNKVYDDGTTIVYEQSIETAQAREGPAGTEKDTKPFVTIDTAKRFSASSVIGTPTGAANIVFNDGTTQVYEVSEVTSTGRYGPAGAEQQTKPFVKITSTKTYQETGALSPSEVGSTNKVYDDGQTEVYEKSVDTAQARPGLKGIETNAQQWGAIKSTTNYTTDATAPDGGSVQIIFADGSTTVYEQTTTEARIVGSTVDIDSQPWGQITWDGVYDTAVGGIRSRQVWSNGVTNVYLNETPTLSISGTTKEQDNNPWGTTVWDGAYSPVPGGHKYRQVTSIGGQSVYLNETATVNFSGTSKEIDPNSWGDVTWNGTFASESSGVRSQKLAQIGDVSIYKNEEPKLNIASGSFVSSIENNPLFSATDTSSFASTPTASGDNARSRLVYALGAERVFENIDTSIVATGNRTYGTVVAFSTPSVLKAINWFNLYRKDGGLDTLYQPIIEEGFEGYMPATVVEKFEKNPTGPSRNIITFTPAPVFIPTPFGNLSIGPTLHGAIPWWWNVGSSDPTYYPIEARLTIPATNHADWRGVGQVLVAYKSDPYKDGFITREVYVTL